MNASVYLQSFGWKEGEALQKGGLTKPILVKHKKDTKGLGHDTNAVDTWWEKLFDGQLKNLEVNNNSNGSVSFAKNEEKTMDTMRRSMSPLYKMFVKGEGLEGTVGKTDHVKAEHIEISSSMAMEQMEMLIKKETGQDLNGTGKPDKDKKRKDKSSKIEKKEKKDKKEKKEKKLKDLKDKKKSKDRDAKKEKREKKDDKKKSKKEDTKGIESTKKDKKSSTDKKRKRDNKEDITSKKRKVI